MVDDGSNESYGKEIEFRAALENELRRGRSLDHYKQMNEIKRNYYNSDSNSDDGELDPLLSNLVVNQIKNRTDDTLPMILIVAS